MNATQRDSVQQIVKDYKEFIARLPIESEQGLHAFLDDPYDEQIYALDDFRKPEVELIVHYKPRQIGDSTIKAADEYAYLYTTGDPVKTLVVTDHDDTTAALHRKYHYFNDNIPQYLRRKTKRSNRQELVFASTMAGVRCLTAGSRAMGKGWTYQRVVCEEMAYWPNDEAVWGSIKATQHEGPHKKTFIISTANGPGNLYHRKVLQAQKAVLAGDPKVIFRFFRWSDHKKYRLQPPDGWEPDQAEYDLGQQFGLDWAQLYWRNQKIWGPEGIGEDPFRRHYPLTIEDGFAVFEGMWFNADLLNEILASLTPESGETRIYEEPQKGVNYAGGIDPSWCNGGDDAVLQILSEDGKQVATFSSNQGGEDRFARYASELLLKYNNAKALVEDNPTGGGKNVRQILEGEGRRIWRKPAEPGQRHPRVPKYWITDHKSKVEAYAHLRQMVNSEGIELNDWTTVQELMHIREENGSIEGQDGYADNHADALYMAEWCRKSLPGASVQRRFPKQRRKARRVAWRSTAHGL
jgi:hypothetical protein